MSAPARLPWWRWLAVVLLALACWLVPLVAVWLNAQEARRAQRRMPAGDGASERARIPLILFAETWPTRAVVKLEEIQGQSAESDVALGARVVANDLARALQQLGVTSEVRRLDVLDEGADLLDHRDIVLVYPTPHASPPGQDTQVVAQRLAARVASEDPRLAQLTVHDVAIAEDAPPAAAAQAGLAGTMAYYHLAYRPGPALVEAMNSLVIYRRLQALATELSAQAAHHD